MDIMDNIDTITVYTVVNTRNCSSGVWHIWLRICLVFSVTLPLFGDTSTNECIGVTVAGAADEYPTVNGYYHYIERSSCFNRRIWKKQTKSGEFSDYHYIFYTNDGDFYNSTRRDFGSWIIGSHFCSSSSTLVVKQLTVASDSEIPCDHPGVWYEYNKHYQQYEYIRVNETYLHGRISVAAKYQPNENITVECTYALSSNSLVGIVAGSIGAVMILFSVVACCFAKYKARELLLETPPVTPTVTAVNLPSLSYNRPPNETPSTQPVIYSESSTYDEYPDGRRPQMHPLQPNNSNAVPPPVYDYNSPPPSYDSYMYHSYPASAKGQCKPGSSG